MLSKSNFEKLKYIHQIDKKFTLDQPNEFKNYAIILSYLSNQELINFIKYFQIYLFKLYKLEISFVEDIKVFSIASNETYNKKEINWMKLKENIKKKKYFHLFISCLHFSF
jgi:hypothetical protein